jgi:hypothetical protein
MTTHLTHRLVTAATLANSVLAGANINRALIDMPAWQQTGPRAWAAFSRHADLSPAGTLLYPLEAFTGAILSVAAAISHRRDRSAPRSATLPINLASLMTIGGLLVTIRAAPNMLRLRHLGDDKAALQQAMDGFQYWGNIRGVFQVLAFVANVWSLVTLQGD